MKKGHLSEELFSYKDDYSLKFSNNNFILAVKDEDFPDRNIVPILYYDKGKVLDIYRDDMEKIVTVKNSYMPDQLLSNYQINQILKVSYGNIIDNDRYFEGSSLPKCKTFSSNVHPVDRHDVVEIFDALIDESESRIKLSNTSLDSLILDVYIEEQTPIFVVTEKKIIGPFRITGKDSEGYFNVEVNHWKPFGEYSLSDNSYIEFVANEIHRKIHVPIFNKLELLNILEFKSNEEVITEFKAKLSLTPETFDEKIQEQLLETLGKVQKIKSIEQYVRENERISKILENSESIIKSDRELAELIPGISGLKRGIDELQNKESLLKNSIEKASARNDELTQETIKKTEAIEQLNVELENLAKTKEVELLKLKSELDQEIEKLKEEKDSIESKIKNETEIKSKELTSLKEKISDLKLAKEDLQYSVDKLKVENQETQRDSLKGLIDLFKNKKYFDFFSGRDLSELEPKEEILYQDFTIDETYTDYFDFRKDLITILARNGRNYEPHFVDNLLLSIYQNTLTIFAGLPGTGKTSLARLLTSILTPKQRVSEVSVSRGWSSSKDLIGFQNPLTNRFHSAPTGVFKLLEQLDFEVKHNKYKSSPLSFIILDEANLSPIEHYWSTFYNLTDSIAKENHPLSISLGNTLNMEFANNLRFIATINYDQTTESLSPRVIDRAHIIQIPTSNTSFDFDNVSDQEIENLRISYQKSIEFFKLRDFQSEAASIEFSDELNVIFNDIKKRFKTLRIPISPRVEIAIKKYCTVAKDWMTKEISRPLDYCVSQRLLPMINVQGDLAKHQLDDLLGIFEKNGLKKSGEILKKIIDTGNEENIFEGNYNYFLTLSYA